MFINVNNIRLYYEKHGEGNPLILLHGNEENHFIFDEAVEKLKKYYTVYTIDSRGHGQSEKVKEYHYQDMANASSDEPELIKNLILAGVNVKPNGVIDEVYQDMKNQYQKTKNPLIKLMLEEPHISNKQLHQVKAKTLLLAGSDDLIKLDHIERISHHIENSKFVILDGEDHSSYIIHNDKIADLIIQYFI